jgi:pantoate--beta-alanine ligase
MQILTTISDFRSIREKIRSAGSVGLVPTMGYLHDGHLELVRHARVANETVAVSVFVNPTQFGPDEDVLTYPRDVERDQVLLEEVGCDLLFYPAVEEVYPPGGVDIHVVPGRIAAVLEGASRPGHFRGVATVVAKLFNIVQPERAYFGQKDGQQLAVIRRMVRDLDFPVEIVAVPTVREPDGLAMSSRNTYLSLRERSAATVLYRALTRVRELHLEGEQDAEVLRAAMFDVLASEPLAVADYVSVADPETLEERALVDSDAMASLAVRIGRTRLIDNVLLGSSTSSTRR